MDNTIKIKLYTKDNCFQCNMTKGVLERGQVSFELINISHDEDALNFVKEELGFTSAPVVVAEGFEPFAGFQPNKLEELVEKFKEGN